MGEIETVRRLRIRGRVQGVGFRWFLTELARERGLCGWVWNESNGDVVTEVGGPLALLDEFERLAGIGPTASHVESIVAERIEDSVFSSLPKRFAVRR